MSGHAGLFLQKVPANRLQAHLADSVEVHTDLFCTFGSIFFFQCSGNRAGIQQRVVEDLRFSVIFEGTQMIGSTESQALIGRLPSSINASSWTLETVEG